MEYRRLPHGNERISIIGMGSAVIGEHPEKEIMETVSYAIENGINYFDLAAGHASIFPAYGKALESIRKNVMFQLHFGADYQTGEYGWSTELETIKRSVAWQLENLKTDYIDFGFIHCLDEKKDLEEYERNGSLQYILDMKSQGIVRHIALSTHSPEIANSIMDRKLIDLMMFSINPMYDYGQGEFAHGGVSERYDLYRRCEKEGVGISVMKTFNAGQLLDAKKSPFKKALTINQCIRYALDKPGVLTVLPGASTVEQLREVLKYLDATDAQCDYSMLGSFKPDESVGQCVYCKHCHPCPGGLDIGLINKYYDLARVGDVLARDHYLTLTKTASDCIGCGHCDSRCPFNVEQSRRMQEIRNYFGK